MRLLVFFEVFFLMQEKVTIANPVDFFHLNHPLNLCPYQSLENKNLTKLRFDNIQHN